jgi:ketosteroid isomerase-like protein
MSSTDVVRASFEAYRAQDLAAAERLLADDYVFTSRQDDHIGKGTVRDGQITQTQVFFGGRVGEAR